MRLLTQNLAANVSVFLTLASDSKTGATGLTLTVQVMKDGGAFATITPTVTERGAGWYNLALTAAHTDTLGDLCFHITAATADPADFKALVVAFNHADAVRLGLTALPNVNAGANGGLPTGDASGRVLLQPTQTGVTIPTVTTTTNLTNLPTMPTDWLTAAGLSAGAVAEIQAGLSTYGGGDTAGTTTLLGRLTATRATGLDNLDAAVSTRLPTASYTGAPSSAVVAAAVWDLVTTGHTGAGTFGAAMNAAGSAGDPLATLVPGAYGVGTAGYRLGTFLDTNVGSRSSHTAADVWGVATRTLSAFGFTVTLAAGQPNYAPAKAGDAMTLTTAAEDAVAVAAADEVTLAHGAGSYARNTEPDNASAAATLARVNLLSLDGTGRVTLAPAGLDAVTVEAGVNARQALAVIASEAAGEWAETSAGVFRFRAVGNPLATRIVAAVDTSGRHDITLTLP